MILTRADKKNTFRSSRIVKGYGLHVQLQMLVYPCFLSGEIMEYYEIILDIFLQAWYGLGWFNGSYQSETSNILIKKKGVIFFSAQG